ncbi:CHAD domain-containing protein [Isoptericola sp. NPDC019482]|uniref:CHAD domain-containing protein n=1 Tax=Isoptericola sp. NPDC019482 TaxID=3154688 RepID=UPI003469F98B
MARTAGDVLAAAIRAQAETVLRVHADVRAATAPDVGGPDPSPGVGTSPVTGTAADAVHDARVAVRRLRAVLRVFPDCTAAEPGTVGALTWWVRALGAARDAEVQRDGLAALARDLVSAPSGVRAGLIVLDGALRAAHDDARTAVRSALASTRCRDLTARVGALASAPPLGPGAGGEAAVTLRPGVERELARVGRRAGPVAGWHGPAPEDGPSPASAAGGTGSATSAARPAPDVVHRLRKAARRARYAAEVLAGSGDHATDRWADDVVAHHRELQDLLGTVHDADVLRATLAGLRGPRTAAAVDACVQLGDERAAQALAAAATALRRGGPVRG